MKRRRRLLCALALLCALSPLSGCPAEPGPAAPSIGSAAGANTPAPDPARDPAHDPAPDRDDDPRPHAQGPSRPDQPDTEEGQNQLALRPKKEIKVGGVPLTVYVVNTDESRQLGLMFVRSLPEDEGMLFVYPRAGRRSFWMRNTYLPLSLAYLTEDGTVDQVVDMSPLEDKTYPSRAIVRHVLEVNRGWFERHGVQEGARVEGLAGLVGY